MFSQQNNSGVTYPITPLGLMQTYLQNKDIQDQIRINTQEWLWDYYECDKENIISYLEDNISRVFGSDIVKDGEWIYDFLNITKR